MLKLIILKHHPTTYLLGKITELDEEPSLLIENCYTITPEVTLQEYPLYTSQRDLFLTSDDIMTILDPSLTVTKLYEEAISE
jgi:hypothetical protein